MEDPAFTGGTSSKDNALGEPSEADLAMVSSPNDKARGPSSVELFVMNGNPKTDRGQVTMIGFLKGSVKVNVSPVSIQKTQV